MIHTLVITLPLLRHYLRELGRQPRGPLRLPVGVSRWAEHVEWLVAAPGSEVGQVLLLAQSDTLTMPSVLPLDCSGMVLIGRGRAAGHAGGVVRLRGHSLAPLHQIRVVGPGMPVIRLQHALLPMPLTRMSEGSSDDATERWSRTIGALGQETWERLIDLRYGIIGVGRTGSLMALALATHGVHHLTLIDPDRVERHNQGETIGLTDTVLHFLKTEAMAHVLTSLALAQPELVAVPTSITRLPALHAAQACDVLVSCVDHDSARLAATGIATLFCKPLLDIATGIHGHGPERQMQLDVRLVLPGRCFLCFGGLYDEATARQVLASAETERAFYSQRNWRHERAGSLLSLNLTAVSRALRLFEAFLGGYIRESRWEHLESDASEHLMPEYPVVPPQPCRLCALMGWGEAGLPRLGELLRHTS